MQPVSTNVDPTRRAFGRPESGQCSVSATLCERWLADERTAVNLTLCSGRTLYCRARERALRSVSTPMIPRFDPTRAVVFDLAQGQLRDDEGSSRLNVPVDALLRLCDAAGPDAVRDFGHTLGNEVGRRVLRRLGEAATGASTEAWVEHVGGDLALLGLGNLSVERWGKVLVLAVANSPAGGDALVASALEGILQRALGRDASAVVLGRSNDTLRVAVLNRRAAERVRQWQNEGASWVQLLERLHEARGEA